MNNIVEIICVVLIVLIGLVLLTRAITMAVSGIKCLKLSIQDNEIDKERMEKHLAFIKARGFRETDIFMTRDVFLSADSDQDIDDSYECVACGFMLVPKKELEQWEKDGSLKDGKIILNSSNFSLKNSDSDD